MTLSPEILAGLSSVAGALLFFGAGFLLAKLKAAPLPVSGAGVQPPQERYPGTPDKVEMLENQLKTITQQRHQGIREIEQLRQINERQKEENKAIIAAAKNRIALLKKQLDKSTAEAEERKAELERISGQLGTDPSEVQSGWNQEKEELASALQKANEALQAREEELQKLSQELETLSSEGKSEWNREKEELATALHMAKEDLKAKEEELEKLTELENQNRDLSLKAELLDEQLQDFDKLQEENHSLKAQLGELETLQEDVDRLKKENAKLQSMGIVLKEPPVQHKITASTDGLGGAYQKVVDQLSQEESSRGVVLADELGLLVAGTGDHMEGMAAMAAVFSNVSGRIESMLPFGEIDQVAIENMEKLTITMQPYQIESDRLVVTALTVGPGPSRDSVTKLIEEAIAK